MDAFVEPVEIAWMASRLLIIEYPRGGSQGFDGEALWVAAKIASKGFVIFGGGEAIKPLTKFFAVGLFGDPDRVCKGYCCGVLGDVKLQRGSEESRKSIAIFGIWQKDTRERQPLSGEGWEKQFFLGERQKHLFLLGRGGVLPEVSERGVGVLKRSQVVLCGGFKEAGKQRTGLLGDRQRMFEEMALDASGKLRRDKAFGVGALWIVGRRGPIDLVEGVKLGIGCGEKCGSSEAFGATFVCAEGVPSLEQEVIKELTAFESVEGRVFGDRLIWKSTVGKSIKEMKDGDLWKSMTEVVG